MSVKTTIYILHCSSLNTPYFMSNALCLTSEPSVADLEYQANLTIQLQAAQKRMGQSYSTLVLGIDMEHNHHMACGKLV